MLFPFYTFVHRYFVILNKIYFNFPAEDPRTSLLFYTSFFVVSWLSSCLLRLLSVRHILFLSFALPMALVPLKKAARGARQWRRRRKRYSGVFENTIL